MIDDRLIYDRFGLLDNGLQRKIELEEASSDGDGVRDVVILGNQVLTQGTRQLVSQWVSVSESLSELVSGSVCETAIEEWVLGNKSKGTAYAGPHAAGVTDPVREN